MTALGLCPLALGPFTGLDINFGDSMYTLIAGNAYI